MYAKLLLCARHSSKGFSTLPYLIVTYLKYQYFYFIDEKTWCKEIFNQVDTSMLKQSRYSLNV